MPPQSSLALIRPIEAADAADSDVQTTHRSPRRVTARRCIALTKAVRDRDGLESQVRVRHARAPGPTISSILGPWAVLTSHPTVAYQPQQVSVDIDCATFDRVLLFLEAAAKGKPDGFAFDINSLEDLARAAKWLG